MIKLVKSTFHKEDETRQALVDFINHADKLSFGGECERFEEAFSKYQGRADAVFVNSGSSANLALIQALLNLGRLNKGDVIAFSALTWSTNVMPMIQLGLDVVPVDVELDTLNVSSKKFIDALEKTDAKALFITNVLGFCDDIDEIKKICDLRGIILIEDNCEALGSEYKGKKLGNFGLASTFSFFVGHHLSTIEGGMIATDDEDLATMLRLVRAHGWDRNLKPDLQEKFRKDYGVSDFYDRYSFYDLGYNLRPTEINGFLGNAQIGYMDEIVSSREKNFFALVSSIKSNDKYFALDVSHMDKVSNFAFPVVCKSEEIRDNLIKKCESEVEVRPIIAGDVTEQPFYSKYIKGDSGLVDSNASTIHKQGLYMGNNPDLTEKEIEKMTGILQNA